MKKGLITELAILAGVLVIVGILAGGAYITRNRQTNGQSTVVGNIQTTPGETGTVDQLNSDLNNVASAMDLKLEVVSPKDGEIANKQMLTVKGISSPGASVAINDVETKADKDGNFSISIKLDQGENTVIVLANDEAGNIAEKDLVVVYKP